MAAKYQAGDAVVAYDSEHVAAVAAQQGFQGRPAVVARQMPWSVQEGRGIEYEVTFTDAQGGSAIVSELQVRSAGARPAASGRNVGE